MTTRFSSPADCYAIFVGDTCSPSRFLNGKTPGAAVDEYFQNWPWDDEPPTEEIRSALIQYLASAAVEECIQNWPWDQELPTDEAKNALIQRLSAA